jgi:outer membrane biosynthesis protein TonB
MIVIVQMTDLITVIVNPTDDMTITTVRLNHITIVIQRVKVQGETISQEKNTAKEDTAVKIKREEKDTAKEDTAVNVKIQEKNTATEDTAVIISKEEMRETKHTVRRNGTRRINKKMIAQKWSDMKRRRREKTKSLLALSVGLPGIMQENARAS